MTIRRATRVFGVVAAACIGLSALASCILADPPPELPKPPARHPNIVHAGVTPPADRPLGELPRNFLVPVELPDPTRSFEWRVFVDFDPLRNDAPLLSETAQGTPGSADKQVISFSIIDLIPPGCHRIEFTVALHFDPSINHASDATGSDSVIWFYTPSGALAGCTTYDAGPDGPGGAFIDAGDASE